MMNIGNTIRRLRKEQDITQEELSEAIGVTPQAVSKWENGAGMPDISQLVPLANYFRVSIDTLFSRDDFTADKEVDILIKTIETNLGDPYQQFEKYTEALKIYPNHPTLLRHIIRCAERLITDADTPQNACLLTIGLRAADQLIQKGDSPLDATRAKESRIRLLAGAGRYNEAAEYAKEFAVPLQNEHSLLADVFHKQKDYVAEIQHRQESIALLSIALADEIAHLGTAYRLNGQYPEALEIHAINLQLPYIIHRENEYHAPLMNFYAISGFDATFCLVLLERHEDALELLERIFDYAENQCPRSTANESLTSPMFCDLNMTPFHGECLEADYLHHIKNPAFEPLHIYPRFQSLLKRYEHYPDHS